MGDLPSPREAKSLSMISPSFDRPVGMLGNPGKILSYHSCLDSVSMMGSSGLVFYIPSRAGAAVKPSMVTAACVCVCARPQRSQRLHLGQASAANHPLRSEGEENRTLSRPPGGAPSHTPTARTAAGSSKLCGLFPHATSPPRVCHLTALRACYLKER